MRTRKIIATAAILVAALLAASVPVAWAGDGILPRRPQPQPTYTCAPHIPAAKARAALVVDGAGVARIYTGKDLRAVRALRTPVTAYCL